MSEIRSIDANALKEELKSWLALPNRDNDARDVVLHLIAVIDNTPTIEYPFYQEAFQSGYEEGYNDGKNEDLIEAFELLKAHCKNRECNKDCVFYRELRAGNDIEQFCGLCEIVMSDDKEVKKK